MRKRIMTATMVAAMFFNFGAAHAQIPPMYHGEWCPLNPSKVDFEICKNMTPEDMAHSIDIATRYKIPARMLIDEKGMTWKYTSGNVRTCKATADVRHNERGYRQGWIVRYDCGELGKRTFQISRWDTHPGDKNRKGIYLQVLDARPRWVEMFDRTERQQREMENIYKQPPP